MLFKYMFYDEDSNSVSYSVSDLQDVTYNPSEQICYVTVAGLDGDILFSMSIIDYRSFLRDIERGAKNNFIITSSNNIGIFEDYNYAEFSWEEHLEVLKTMFTNIRGL